LVDYDRNQLGEFDLETRLNSWLHIFKPLENAQLRLYCFHYAGGAAGMFGNWVRALPDNVEVRAIQLPGRWERLDEPLFTEMPKLIEALSRDLNEEFRKPYAFLGFSIGARIAFELARKIRRDISRGSDLTLPVQFFSISRAAPDFISKRLSFLNLDDTEFLNVVAEHFEGIPKELLEEEEFRKMFAPILRADLLLLENCKYENELPFSFPVSVMGGINDSDVPEIALEKWASHTSGKFELHRLPCGHFLTKDAEIKALGIISQQLQSAISKKS
jgi:medium-chain acyl-[acyl-carrier-protein] hydrolase